MNCSALDWLINEGPKPKFQVDTSPECRTAILLVLHVRGQTLFHIPVIEKRACAETLRLKDLRDTIACIRSKPFILRCHETNLVRPTPYRLGQNAFHGSADNVFSGGVVYLLAPG